MPAALFDNLLNEGPITVGDHLIKLVDGLYEVHKFEGINTRTDKPTYSVYGRYLSPLEAASIASELVEKA